MPRHKTTKKRSFRGNQFFDKSWNATKEVNIAVNESNSPVSEVMPRHTSSEAPPISSEARPTSEATPMHTTEDPASKGSSSKKKLSYINDFVSSVSDENTSKSVIVDLDILSSLVNKFSQCKICNANNSVVITEEPSARKGLACKLTISCTECQAKKEAMSSKVTRHRLYEVNTRFAYSLRCIGKGETSGRSFCAVMNLPPPNTRFSKHNNHLLNALQSIGEISMQGAALEAIRENEGNTDIAAAFDGTWQRRGYSSLNGVVTTTAFDTGKVLDIECFTKYCQKCTMNKRKCQDQCFKNYCGSSGGMECLGVEKIFARSEQSRGVRYLRYLGDGDSNSFAYVCGKKPYGPDVTIQKLECIGHVQKRMGSRLRRLKTKMKGIKLGDGKVLGGKNRLTDVQIDKLQNYYGLAIRRNKENPDKMHKEVWAIYYHKVSTNEDPHHGFCPTGEDSWCGFNKIEANNTKKTYEHKNSLPDAVMEKIKPIFEDLSSKDLLSKCAHGRTQNPNESLNNLIWERVPKNTFVGLNTLKIGVLDAVVTFNEGSLGRAKVLHYLGIKPGFNALAGFFEADKLRVKKAEIASQQLTKEARKKRRANKRKKEDQEAEDKSSYGAGEF